MGGGWCGSQCSLQRLYRAAVDAAAGVDVEEGCLKAAQGREETGVSTSALPTTLLDTIARGWAARQKKGTGVKITLLRSSAVQSVAWT